MTYSGPAGVAILMGLFDGAPWISTQLQSFLDQDHANWTLTVADDGSSDAGPEIVEAFGQRNRDRRVTLVAGPRRGFAANFLTLLRDHTGDVPYVALSDQDDQWLPERLSRGIAALAPFGALPALYCARTIQCDAFLRPMRISPLWPRPFGMANALVQNVAAGNTIMLNRAMADQARRSAPWAVKAGVVAHDWWLYILASAIGGAVVQDDAPVLRYRLHASNAMGRNDTPRARWLRARRLFNGTFAGWIDANLAALSQEHDHLTPEARRAVSGFPGLRAPGVVERLSALRRLGLYRHGRIDDLLMRGAVVAGRL